MTSPAAVPRDPLTLVTRLRALGVDVPLDASVAFGRAIAALPQPDRTSLWWAACATLTSSPEHREALKVAFNWWWAGAPALPLGDPLGPPTDPEVVDAGEHDADCRNHHDVAYGGDRRSGGRYSPAELLRERDFAALGPEELAECYRLMRALRLELPTRRSSRRRVARGARGEIDLARTLRHARRTDGDVVVLRRRQRAQRPRRLVLLCDVSGSMERYSRSLLRFLHAAVASGPKVEAFTLGTRLTRITRELRLTGVDRALAEAVAAIRDWSGGTRLGECLRCFNDEWGTRGLARGAVVVILSDGWDRGDPALIAAEMSRLARVAHRVVWVNPLKASEGYEPSARGMAAALPHVDEFVDGHSLAAFEELAEVIRR